MARKFNTEKPKGVKARALGPKTPRVKKEKAPLQLQFPEPVPEITRWIVLGLDPSLSRTGYSLMEITRDAPPRWIAVGSVKPDDASVPIWIRSKAIALAIKEVLLEVAKARDCFETGLIISAEFPTPQNDFLTSLSRILHIVLLDGEVVREFAQVRGMLTNAATLRSLMGLVQRGAKNKVENVAKAYEYLDKGSYPNLDTDACDAVLMAIMGRYAAAFLMGTSEVVPDRFKIALTNAAKEIKGKGNNARVITKGLLHRPEYWYAYEPARYAVQIRDARVKTRLLTRREFAI
jgi:hypothetical protein